MRTRDESENREQKEASPANPRVEEGRGGEREGVAWIPGALSSAPGDGRCPSLGVRFLPEGGVPWVSGLWYMSALGEF